MKRVRAGVISVYEGKLLVVRLQDPVSRKIYLFPPGGAIETGETPAQAAERETLEETGYRVVIDPMSERVLDYPFVWAGVSYDCTTYFYRAALASQERERVTPPAYQLGVEWLSLSGLGKAFSYHEDLRTTVTQLAYD